MFLKIIKITIYNVNSVPQTGLNNFALSIPLDLYYQRVTEIPTSPGFIYVSLTN